MNAPLSCPVLNEVAVLALALLLVVGMAGVGLYARNQWQVETVRQQALAEGIVRQHQARIEADRQRDRAASGNFAPGIADTSALRILD